MDLWQMSLSGGVIIILVTAVRAVLINRLPKKTFLFLWGMVLLRLMVPFSIPASYSVYSLFLNAPMEMEVWADAPLLSLLQGQTETSEEGSDGTLTVLGENVLSKGGPEGNLFSVWEVIWFGGFLLLTVLFIVCYAVCLRNFKTSLPLQADFVCEWKKMHPIRRKVSVRQYDRISSPLTYGVVRPVILLPKTLDISNRQQLRFILEHEFVHICRFDMVLKMIVAVCLCVHWFNPFVWVFFILFNRDLELACDEAVVGRSDKTLRADYARTLLSMEEHRMVPNLLFSSFSKNAMEERIVAIMKPKKYTVLGIVGVLAIVVLIGAGFLTSAQAAEPGSDSKVHHSEEHESDNVVHHSEEHESDGAGHHQDVHESDAQVRYRDEVQNENRVNHPEEHQVSCEMIWPTESVTLSLRYGERVHPVTGEIKAVDHICIKGEKGDNIFAAISGTVTVAEYSSDRGNYIVLTNEEGVTTIYSHLQDLSVSAGDMVTAGDVIGTMGATGLATGPNLAFGVVVDDEPVDPLGFFDDVE